MSQSAKRKKSQGASPGERRAWPGAAGTDVLNHTASALARAGFTDPALVLRWSEIAGEAVARAARPTKLQEAADGAVLTLRCEPGAAVFLQHETRSLVDRLNAYLGTGRIARIRLKTGTIQTPEDIPNHPARALPAQDAPKEGHRGELGLAATLEHFEEMRRKLRKNAAREWPARDRPD
ncbi:MAG: DUF721 domain-containing protein [Proteobacteria bacterium]|nr:DUF721 domain-containing protein [Pseudomonadota bacterium]